MGRAATLIDLNSEEFATLPPHFDTSEGPVLTTEQWEDILPGYSTYYPACFRCTLNFLLASLCYHEPWLRDTLPPAHPLRLNRVWTSGILQCLRPKVHCGTFSNDITNLVATGIPPYVIINVKVSSMEVK